MRPASLSPIEDGIVRRLTALTTRGRGEWREIFSGEASGSKRMKVALLAEHPYDVPELVAQPIAAGHHRNLDWLEASVRMTET